MNKEQTGIMIKEARIKKGLTQNNLGNLVGVSNKAVSRWENGESFPYVALLDNLADVLELSIEELVLGEKKVISSENRKDHAGDIEIKVDMNEHEEIYTGTAVKELVKLVKLQKQADKRKMLYGYCAMAVWAGIVLCSFISTYRINSISRFAGLLLGVTGCVLGVSVVMLSRINADYKEPLKGSKGLERVLQLISSVTGIYMIALMLSAVLLYENCIMGQ